VSMLSGVGRSELTECSDTIKTRSQAAGRVTTLQAISSIWADGGVKAFWRGTSMRLSRTVFSGGESFLFSTYLLI